MLFGREGRRWRAAPSRACRSGRTVVEFHNVYAESQTLFRLEFRRKRIRDCNTFRQVDIAAAGFDTAALRLRRSATVKASRAYQRKGVSFLWPRNSNGDVFLGPTRQSVTPSPSGRGPG